DRISHVVPFDMGGWMTLDPDSLLPTGTMRSGKPPGLVRTLWDNEVDLTDLNHFPTLVRKGQQVATLYSLDDERLDRSERYHLHPGAGRAEEERVMFWGPDRPPWGAACLHREQGSRPFNANERRFLADAAIDLGEGLQRSLARLPKAEVLPIDPGVALL